MHQTDQPMRPSSRDFGRLVVRATPGSAQAPPGLHELNLDEAGEALLYVPERAASLETHRLIVMLHGAGASAVQSIDLLQATVDNQGPLVLAPTATDGTWDLLRGGWGPDLALMERALDQVVGRYAVERDRLAIGGFSDGASYALSVGFTNGSTFSHMLAFSPGFLAPQEYVDRPACFVSHGVHDRVLPIDRCSRRLVAALQRAGYAVEYREFDGGHEVPRSIVDEAVDWYLGSG